MALKEQIKALLFSPLSEIARSYHPPAPPAPRRRIRRDYDLARIDRLTSAFLAPVTTADTEIRYQLPIMRARSRELARNNDYAKKFLKMCHVNVVGRVGVTLQNKARDPNGKLDIFANTLIEREFSLWGKKKNCTVDGRLSWYGVQELFIKTAATDGEVLIRLVRGYKNPWRFSLQFLEADLLDELYNVPAISPNGNEIKMGIEFDPWGRPVAYHLRKKHPGDSFQSQYSTQIYERVPASEILHIYVQERPTQSRGVPWMHTAGRRLNQVGEYEYAELVAARIGASKMGFYEPKDDVMPTRILGDDPTEETEEHVPTKEAEPGMFETLPAGYTFKSFEPEHPTAQFDKFVKASLRGVSAGLGVSYNGLANDLEGVNFSSMRAGTIEERDAWKVLQKWIIDELAIPVFEAWLDCLLLTSRTTLPYSKLDKFNAPVFLGRIFEWVDPENDIDAELKQVRAGWKSNRQVVQERLNMDLEDLYEQLAEEKKLAAQYGLIFDLSASKAEKPPAAAGQSEGGNNVQTTD